MVRTAGDPLALVARVRRVVHDIAPNAPVYDARTLALLAAAVVAASWLPARRAAAVSPTEALRAD